MTMKSIFTKEYAALMEVLARARKAQDLSQQAVAERLGKPQSFVSKYESSERRLDVIEFFAVAKALGCQPLELLRQAGLV